MPRNIIPEEAERRARIRTEERAAEDKRQKELWDYAEEKKFKKEISLNVLKTALENEEESKQISLRRFGQEKVKVSKLSREEYSYQYKHDASPITKLDQLFINLKDKQNSDAPVIRGKITDFGAGNVYFTTKMKLNDATLYSVSLSCNRSMTDACLEALDKIQRYKLVNYINTFNDYTIDKAKKRNIKPPSSWVNKDIEKDLNQKNTVLKILSESAYPNPFVISGGPGTGKTSVLVETVVQILMKKSFANVLIMCQSNSACDEVGIRLRKFLPAVKVFRYYKKNYFANMSINKDHYFKILRENSTYNELHNFQYPKWENLAKYKIIISTLTTAIKLSQSDNKHYGLPKDHFDFIFIDECCYSTEPETWLPIAALGLEHKKVNANIILVGDDKLIGPVLFSGQAKDLGLEQSLLERIMLMDLYNPETSPDRIVRLNNNYRSHPEIMRYSNETFYNSTMISMIKSSESNFAINWKQLPDPNIPIVLHSVPSESVEVKEYDGSSYFSVEEIEQVFDYVQSLMKFGFGLDRKIKEEQIGIISPYLAQVKRIRKRLSDSYRNIDIGTTEFFQGREKPIMIVSAVRTKKLDLANDFLDNPRRLNVLLTRAKSLMIVIGNLEKLLEFSSWKPFIENCVRSRLARKGPLREEVIDGEDFIERITLLRITDETSDSTSD